MLLIDILNLNNMNIKKIIPHIIDLTDNSDFKTIVRYLKGLNQAINSPLKMGALKQLVRQEIKNRKRILKLNAKNNPLKIQSSKALITSDIHQDWIIQDILPEGSINILSAKPGSFKTWLTLYFALCISKGDPVFGVFNVKKSNVLIIDEEDSDKLIKDRLIKLGDNGDTNLSFSIMTGFMADNHENIEMLLSELIRRKIKVLIIDSLIRIHSGDENSAKDMSSLFRKISVLKEKGITVLINHHNRKGQDNQNYGNQMMRGSVDILAALECQMMIKRVGNDLIINQTKNRIQPELKPFIISPTQEEDKLNFVFKGYSEDTHNQQIKTLHQQDSVLSFIEENDSPITQEDLSKQFQGAIGKNVLLKILKTLEKEQKIIVETKEKNKKFYTINSAF